MPIDRTSHLVAPTPDENDGQRRSFYRSFVQFLSSNIGLIIVVIAYSVGGAFLFILLEQYIELQNCQEGSLLENVSISNISETMYNYIAVTSDNTSQIYDQIVSYLNNFTNDVYERKSDYRYTGQDCSSATGWTFPSALLFTISIITSIGYGQVTPTSWEGQITCICYALIGIPIFLLCLTNISSILGDMFRFLYSSLLRYACCACRVYTRNRQRKNHSGKTFHSNRISYVGTTSVDPSWPEANDQPDGNKVTSDAEYFHGDFEEDVDDIWNRLEGRVPILAVIVIIIGYVCLGAFMFCQSEGWSMCVSIYFCYITLSTIGFGDYVPGITSSSTNGLRFMAASCYIIIGLAVLAMCFDLIKESIVDKIEWVGQKFGVVAMDDDQIDDDITRYARFEYSQARMMNETHFGEKVGPHDAPPPAYEHTLSDEQWFESVREKVHPSASDSQIKH